MLPAPRALPVLLLLALALPSRAAASDFVIEAGREGEILGLIAPYEDGAEVRPGWTLVGVSIARSEIRYTLQGPEGSQAALVAAHRDTDGETTRKTASFRLSTEDAGSPGAEAALAALADAIAANDAGAFWRVREEARRTDPPPGARNERPFDGLLRVLSDGGPHLLLGLLLLFGLVGRGLREAPRWVAWTLLLVTVGGALLRLGLAAPTTMTAWTYARVPPLTNALFQGPVLGLLSKATGTTIGLAGLIAAVSLLLASVTPVIVFAHARYLFKDARAGLVAAALVAVLPMHLRFSASDVFFIQSIAGSSLAFTLLYTANLEPSRLWRLLSLLALPAVAYATLLVRPLNLVFVPLFVVTGLWLVGPAAPLRRRLASLALLLAATVPAAASFLGAHGQGVADALAWELLQNSFATLVDPVFNTLVNPRMTPPGFLLLALGGAALLLRRREGRLRGAFLLAWLAAFFLTHAVIIPEAPEMQARYHLHLVVPFALLAAWGAWQIVHWRRWTVAALALYALAVPWLHLGFETDVDFDPMREYDFLATLPAQVPEGCTVVELAGSLIGAELPRTERHARALVAGEIVDRYETWPVGRLHTPVDEDALFGRLGLASAAARDRSDEIAEAVVRDLRRLYETSPDCVYLYEGLRCWSEKTPSAPVAPACLRLRELLVLEPVAAERFPPRVYDGNFARGYSPEMQKGEGEIGLTLYRVTGLRATPRHRDER